MWARFSPAQMARRRSLARDLMRRRDLGALLVFGTSGVNRHLGNHVAAAREVGTPQEEVRAGPVRVRPAGHHRGRLPIRGRDAVDRLPALDADGRVYRRRRRAESSGRRIAQGDVVITEISASYWGYSGQIHWPVFAGAESTTPWRRLFDGAARASRRMAAAIRLGATEGDVIRAASVAGEATPSPWTDAWARNWGRWESWVARGGNRCTPSRWN
ncbi:MAG: hypothetical protein QN187_05035 [Armatimonadota bacterium]|nr:hypothetical protein [Armatimonadota bacterium]MDR7520545.1 hypothetical protein [Armatimonadota bacterium]MDR7550638.1 hypothetical protein [Armatimonadota bacterium]